MNAASDCHEIPGCPNLFIDAFRGHYLSSKSKDASNVFVLTHYHGDHYGNLPRENRYAGPAVIHCTPVTAALLRRAHQVPHHLVCEHRLGETWDVVIGSKGGGGKNGSSRNDCAAPGGAGGAAVARVTFYDANHCPGAALVLVEVPPDRHRNAKGSHAASAVQHHLHTGDFRYHPRMRQYPLLREAVVNRTLDCLLLDTTFAHPRHAFEPQAAAVDSIASQVQDLLLPSTNGDTLVLLGCYSIGKERVLWEVASRTNGLVHVSEAKLQKLQCLTSHEDVEDCDGENDVGRDGAAPLPPSHSRIVDRCTTDPGKSDVHVVPMGLAGDLWPYFQPNFGSCYEYAAKLGKKYRRVVAFLPTGWAQGSKWNREHSECRQVYKGVEVEVRLVAYSEHSSFDELQEFVAYCRPRKVLPTVYADDNDRRRIQSLFPIDSQRAKQHFFDSFSAAAAGTREGTPTKKPAEPIPVDDYSGEATFQLERMVSQSHKRRTPPSSTAAANEADASHQLVAMGFALKECQEALGECQGDVARAVDWLLARRATRVASSGRKRKVPPSPRAAAVNDGDASRQLATMGSTLKASHETLTECNGNLEHAEESLHGGKATPKASEGRTLTISPSSRAAAVKDVDSSQRLVAMGFAREACEEALTESNGNLEQAVEWLLRRKSTLKGSPRSVVSMRAPSSTTLVNETSSKAPSCTRPQTCTAGDASASEESTPGQRKEPPKTLLHYFDRKA